MDRRTLFQLVSVISVAQAQQPPAAQAAKATRAQLAAALQLLGLNFDEKQQEVMLTSVNRTLANFERLRKIDVPLDTEPAFTFHPGLPARRAATGQARFQPLLSRAPKAKTWKSVEELAFHSVAELAPLVRARLVTSVELTEMYLARLKRYGPKLNCVITLTEDLARRQAKRADEEIRRGKYRGPLHGIPWGAKDLFATKGIPTTWGAEPFREQVMPYDATAVERLDQAGAVLVAKLSMGALAQGGLWFGGMTRTPWKPEQTSSGSSAGSAAATAAGLVGFSLGTETLGSIVSPSVRCGTVGLRPTYGRVSRYGAMGLSWTMDKIGPICRAVEDCALVLNAIYGPDGRDRSVQPDPLHWEPRRVLAGLRVGIIQKAFDGFKDAEKKVYDQALADLKKLGVAMQPVEFDDSMAQTLRFLLMAEAAAAFDDITRDNRVAQLRGQAPGDWPNSFRSSRLIPAVEYIRAQRARTILQRQVEKTFEAFDVIVTPPSAVLTTTNLTGHPQVVLPCGFVEGMPRSLSFLGGLYDEGTPLRLALAFEQATEHHTKRPPVEKLDAFDPQPTEPKAPAR